ncbi:MoaD/ThiS family protein [Chryseobacterium indologenes]|uniref:Molybdopterin synthase sulfur carrier subunit n=1 Tax=Chryseobacterium indologenes TaxID=253 RepID=A0A1Z3VZ91_CHRID|nr:MULTISPECIES: MoaD/ThiS family protein [Chryseobacterium]ASE60813.1 MoaD/ThiS family protein [Chryseobacterium indologenes]ATN04925.1 MoaD/ThiS family protein [Chryseobacterium indologenes]AYY86324.1 MoaD/ThiS family protein [Chryseobacterium indologenes]AYZ36100.1 MoaD/ThiS family protein [Chryseobacterium indologenes]AZB16508.1 MoaD/ThiS family protein [Chryseobacterium indologenes]
MKLKILAFGIVKDIFGGPEKELEVEDSVNVGQLKKVLEDQFPEFKKLKSYFIALDEEYAEDDQIIHNTNEIAIIPPVSGG